MNWQNGCPLFWLLRRTYPWGMLVAIALRFPFTRGLQKQRDQVRFWITLLKIDLPGAFQTLSELLLPETWLI